MPLETVASPRVAPPLRLASTAITRPLLKWPGGKRWQLPHLRPLWEPHSHRRLVEPFCGGLAVSLGLSPDRALLNDLNPHVVNLYRQVQRGLQITLPMRNSRTLFDAHRKRFNRLIAERKADAAEAAGLFYYLNRTGFNGLCRFNRDGHFNVPFGQHERIPYTRDFTSYRRTFASWQFSNQDFASLQLESGDFIYADPPYDVDFTEYSKGGFSWEDQVRVAEWLAQHPGPVVLSNQATRRILRLYKSLGFALRFLEAPRRISCNGNRTPAREVLATRNL